MTENKSIPIKIARLAWIALTVLIVVLVGLGISDLHESFASAVDARSIDALNLTLGGYASYLTAVFLLVVITHLFIGVVVFLRGPNDWMALDIGPATVALWRGRIFSRRCWIISLASSLSTLSPIISG